MTEKLLPCPFCGGEAHIEQHGTPRQSCIIECESCGCRLETGEEGAMCGKSWNRRATKPNTPKGWKLVPAQPTVEMSTAAKEESKRWSTRGGEDETLHYCTYVAMLAASPTPPAQEDKA